jgi:FixJ family two-component response regulator
MDAAPSHSEAIVAIVVCNQAILDALQLLLVVSGWEVRTYNSGEAFTEDICENQPDCLILDCHLPGLSAADVARTLLTRYPDTPIIGITGGPDSKPTDEILLVGDAVMLTKPVSTEQIVSKVRAVMA